MLERLSQGQSCLQNFKYIWDHTKINSYSLNKIACIDWFNWACLNLVNGEGWSVAYNVMFCMTFQESSIPIWTMSSEEWLEAAICKPKFKSRKNIVHCLWIVRWEEWKTKKIFKQMRMIELYPNTFCSNWNWTLSSNTHFWPSKFTSVTDWRIGSNIDENLQAGRSYIILLINGLSKRIEMQISDYADADVLT